ncbi:MAG TPA: 50S ribosomal protein L6, partial [Firmicutes bacterium]|nr:50S ribosomal protein L6 [Bacillota bacterium]
MSRIGRLPIEIPQGVQVNLVDNHIIVKGPKGQLEKDLPGEVKVEIQDNQVVVTRPSDERRHRALHGLT